MVKKKAPKGSQRTTCTDWYLITTTYYTDGTFDVSEEYLGTTCTENVLTVCPDCGTGGYVPPPDEDSVQVVVSYVNNESSSTDSYDDTPPPPNGFEPETPDGSSMPSLYGYSPVRYQYRAEVWRVEPAHEIFFYDILPTVVSPLHSPFFDGRNGVRKLTPFGYINVGTILPGGTSMTLYWFCYVNAQYVCTNGQNWSRQWDNSKTTTNL